DVLPADVAGLELPASGVPTVADPARAAHTAAALGEVQPVAHLPADPVELGPPDQRGVHAAGEDEVLDQVTHRVVGQGGDHSGAQAHGAAQPTGHAGLAPALPDA